LSAALLVSVFLIASAGLIYELVASSLASYLIGDSVFQFSTVIGCYLFAMGVGSWLSRYLRRGLVAQFIGIELSVALVGGFSSMALMLAFAYTNGFRLALYALVLIVGVLVGLEIPLLMRILRDRFAFKDVIANEGRTRPFLPALRHRERIGGALDDVPLRQSARPAASPPDRFRGNADNPRCGYGGRPARHRTRRGQHLLRRSHLLAGHPLSAHGADRVEG
jgi:hypothetical protein